MGMRVRLGETPRPTFGGRADGDTYRGNRKVGRTVPVSRARGMRVRLGETPRPTFGLCAAVFIDIRPIGRISNQPLPLGIGAYIRHFFPKGFFVPQAVLEKATLKIKLQRLALIPLPRGHAGLNTVIHVERGDEMNVVRHN